MITGVILARNEEDNIVDCLHSLRPHVAELILIDMESSDRTVELAHPLVSKILAHPLIPNFDAARNVAIGEAGHEWLWFLDADERVSERTGRVVNELVRGRGQEFVALTIPFKSYFCGQWMRHCGWWPGYTMARVLKRGHFRFSERLHGGVEFNGPELRLPPDPELAIEHFSYRDVHHYLEKLNRYTSTEAQQLAAGGAAYDWRRAFAAMVHDLWVYYERNPGRLDGERGWILSWLSGWYRWLSHAKLIDHGKIARLSSNEPNAPASLDDVILFMEEELASIRRHAPQIPLGITWRSPIWDYSGYADESRTLVKALSRGDRSLGIEEIRWNDRICHLDPRDASLLRALSGRRRSQFSAAITNCIPTLVEPDRCAALNILRTTFETDRIPSDWLPYLHRFDEIWVTSTHAAEAFRRSWIPAEKIRAVPSCVDTEIYKPTGPKRRRFAGLAGRFVFLSVFDWQLRKGWDLLLKAYARNFAVGEKAALLLKVSRLHGHATDTIRRQANAALREVGAFLHERNDIVWLDDTLSANEMASLYRSADAFVLPTRGEGWGRPYMEAMACGLPVVATRASGQMDFLNDSMALLVPANEIPVSDEAARELPVYAGHRWYEPDLDELGRQMRRLYDDPQLGRQIGRQAASYIRRHFGLDAGRQAFEEALGAAEQRFVRAAPPEVSQEQVRVAIDGEFFAGHSFSVINERIAEGFLEDANLALSLSRRVHNPVFDANTPGAEKLQPYFGRALPDGPQVVIRHAFPPDWSPPRHGRWVHIQPWEFGHLPTDWIAPLQEAVDEIWAPSNYVRRVYEQSGIPRKKIHVIPWGIDPDVFNPNVPPLILPGEEPFRFLFVGGTIARKGFDILLDAYLEEFETHEDVCLVVKDMGVDSFYRYGNYRDQALAARDDPNLPTIMYYDMHLTKSQLASLYASCDCLAAPYRGEGFGLPILEAMACGLPVIVPRNGPTDDFVTDAIGIRLPSEEVETEHPWALASPPLELKISTADLRKAMRTLFENRQRAKAMGAAAAVHVRRRFTWRRTIAKMIKRVNKLAQRATAPVASTQPPQGLVAACVRVKNAEATLADCLARIKGFVDEIVVFDEGSDDRSCAIAREYGGAVVESNGSDNHAEHVRSQWHFSISPHDLIHEDDANRIAPLLRSQSDMVTEISLRLQKSILSAPEPKCSPELRFARRSS